MKALVVAEHDNDALTQASLSVITAAGVICEEVSVLVAGSDCGNAAKTAAQITGVIRVYHAEAAHYANGLAEELAPLIVSLAGGVTHILAPSSTFGKNLLPRAAALLDVDQVSEVIKIESADTFQRPLYAGNAVATVRSGDPIKVLTIRPAGFAPAEAGRETAPIEAVDTTPPLNLSTMVRKDATTSNRPDLSSARIVVAGGRGLGSAEQFQMIEELADVLGAAVGATRAAVDAGYVSNDFQVGQTGKVIAPDLYIAVGISGAIQHLAGIKDSKCIVAINKDEEAPIFDIADYGLVADLFEALPRLRQELE